MGGVPMGGMPGMGAPFGGSGGFGGAFLAPGPPACCAAGAGCGGSAQKAALPAVVLGSKAGASERTRSLIAEVPRCSPFPAAAGMNGHAGGHRRPKKDAPHEMELHCSLEELYRGTTRRMKIRWGCSGLLPAVLCWGMRDGVPAHALPACAGQCLDALLAAHIECQLPAAQTPPLWLLLSLRPPAPACRSRKRLDAHGQQRPDSEMLEINVRPGWKAGTKITFQEKGEKEGEWDERVGGSCWSTHCATVARLAAGRWWGAAGIPECGSCWHYQSAARS